MKKIYDRYHELVDCFSDGDTSSPYYLYLRQVLTGLTMINTAGVRYETGPVYHSQAPEFNPFFHGGIRVSHLYSFLVCRRHVSCAYDACVCGLSIRFSLTFISKEELMIKINNVQLQNLPIILTIDILRDKLPPLESCYGN